MAHNYYREPGGEDQVFSAEASLVEACGHVIQRYTVSSREIESLRPFPMAKAVLWNGVAHRDVRELLRNGHWAVAHFHNTFPLISPAAYYAAKREGVAVVQTLHNYRLLCPNAILSRSRRACEDCLGKAAPWPSIVHACYRGSRLATGAVALMLTIHRAIGTWAGMVDLYIALTEFARDLLIRGGLPADRIVVKPNFVHPDPGVGDGQGGFALFVGRLSAEKGIGTLLQAWEAMNGRVPLKIVGDGPLGERLGKATRRMPGIEWLGSKPPSETYDLMGEAKTLILPSECYETFGRVAIEAYAKGTPVVAANIGAIAELVQDGRTGLLFAPGNREDLAAKVEWAWTHPEQMAEMGREARAEYEARYTAERNYQMLMDIYDMAITRARQGR